MLVQRRFDLWQFDPESPQLHLVIEPCDEVEGTVRQQSNEVRGFVQPGAGLVAEWVRHELLRRQLGPSQITATHANPSDVQFPRHPDWDRLPALVQDVEPYVFEGLPQGRVIQPGQRPFDQQMIHIIRTLGRAISVQQRDPRIEGGPSSAETDRQGLGIGDHPAELLQAEASLAVFLLVLDHRAQQCGDRFQHGSFQTLYFRQEVSAIPRVRLADDLDDSSHQQDRENLPHRDIEGGRGVLRDDILRTQSQIVHLRPEVVHHAAMFDHGPFGPSGRTRRIKHIGQVIGVDEHAGVLAALPVDRFPFQIDADAPGGVGRKFGLEGLLG